MWIIWDKSRRYHSFFQSVPHSKYGFFSLIINYIVIPKSGNFYIIAFIAPIGNILSIVNISLQLQYNINVDFKFFQKKKKFFPDDSFSSEGLGVIGHPITLSVSRRLGSHVVMLSYIYFWYTLTIGTYLMDILFCNY